MPVVKSSVKALIIKDEKVLVLKERLDDMEVWDIPGGKMEYGETPVETVAREVWEELQLKVVVKKHAGLFWFFHSVNKDQIICQTFVCTLADPSQVINLENNPALDEHIVEYTWVTKKELLAMTNKFPNSFFEMIKDVDFKI